MTEEYWPRKHPYKKKVVSRKKIITINVPVYLIELMNKLQAAGVVESRSEFCRDAVKAYMLSFFDTYGQIVLRHLNPDEIDPDYDLIDPPGHKNLSELQQLCKDAQQFYVDKLKTNGGSLRE